MLLSGMLVTNDELKSRYSNLEQQEILDGIVLISFLATFR